ncbi:hypothetical protein RQP46_009361 [Phenoliferia psychrophenolica]
MRFSNALTGLCVLSSLSSAVGAHTYKLQTSLKGQSLLNFFTFQTGKADNGGVAYYQSLAAAKKSKLVNHQAMNSMSSHTGKGCMQQTTGFSGLFMMSGKNKNNCDATTTNSQGCGVRSKSATSFGAPFNTKGGGVYAMQWDSSGVKVYHWLRSNVPSDVNGGHPNPSAKWGVPVINTNLCGTWASGVWDQDMSYAGGKGSCSAKTGFKTCEAYIQANGSKLTEMYWLINSIKIYK